MQIANTIASKLIVASVAIATIFAVAMPAQAQTVEELQDMIADLMAQVAALSGGSSSSAACTFTMALTVGSQGAEVTCLQNYLIGAGFSISAGATGYFGAQTQAAVAAWQAANGVTPAAGYFGPVSQAKYKAIAGSSNGGSNGGSTGSGDLEGGAGDIGDADWESSLNNEEVGEDAEDVEVAGLEIEADGSDIELTAISLNFDKEGSDPADEDFEDYATEVSVWLDGEEVARVDVDEEFSDDDNYNGTITLEDAVIREDETGDLVVAVSGVSNLDSDQLTDTWTVGVESVRFRDAQGSTVTDSSTGDIGHSADGTGAAESDERAFSFESFATSADIDLNVSNGDDEVNDTQTIQVDGSDDTNDVDLFSFNLEVEGDSELVVDDLEIDFDFSGTATEVNDILASLKLMMDGEEIAEESAPSGQDSVTFDNIDLELEAGETYEMMLVVDFLATSSASFAEGDTIQAQITSTELANWNVDDETGEELTSSEKSGSASTDDHIVYASGVRISEGSADSTDTKDTNGDTAGGERGLYTVNFEVTAFDENIYIPTGATVATTTAASIATNLGVAYGIENSSGVQILLNSGMSASSTAAVSSSADTSGSYWVIEEGETETFTLTVEFTPASDGFYRLQLDAVNYNVGAAATADTHQGATPQEEYETEFESLDAI